MNISTHLKGVADINTIWPDVVRLCDENSLAGVELLPHPDSSLATLPTERVIGVHLSFWLNWYSLWNGKWDSLIRNMGCKENITKFFGAMDTSFMIARLRDEIVFAEGIGAEYVVFHVGHTELVHSFDFLHDYSDIEICAASADFINEVTKGKDFTIPIYFENLWWPGLRFTSREVARFFLERVQYEHIGFMLDTSHLINTNPTLTNEAEAITYIRRVVENLGDMKEKIRGVHLAKSLRREYFNSDKSKLLRNFLHTTDAEVKYKQVRDNIAAMDPHLPFESPAVRKLIEFVEPDYVVHEFVPDSFEDLKGKLTTQNGLLNMKNDEGSDD